MLTYFVMISFVGYIMESLYISLRQRKWISSGLLKGPFNPLYGIGALLLMICSPYLHHPFLYFFIGAILMSGLEYISSICIEKVFHKKCWDYSKHFLNYKGRICLLYTCLWGFLSYLFLTYLYPWMLLSMPDNDITCLISFMIVMIMIKALIETIDQQKKTIG